MIFYGTEVPPQPNDPPRRLGGEKSNLDTELYDGEYGQNVLEFEPGIAGQWKHIQEVRHLLLVSCDNLTPASLIIIELKLERLGSRAE